MSTQLNVMLPAGYRLRRLTDGLNFPTAIAMSDTRIWISEAGLPGMEAEAPPRVKEILADGSKRIILTSNALPQGRLLGPITDVTYHDGWLYIAHREIGANGWAVGAISRLRVGLDSSPAVCQVQASQGPTTGGAHLGLAELCICELQKLITSLPASGDHYVSEIVFDRQGRAFFSIGAATNSSVVGPDNHLLAGWLLHYPTYHDFAPVELELAGVNYTTDNPLTEDSQDTAVTAPYHRFNSGAMPAGTVVRAATPLTPREGMIAAGGTVYSFDPKATNPTVDLRLEAWGLRNPYGLGFDPSAPGRLYITNNGADVRGVAGQATDPTAVHLVEGRPIGNDWDDLFLLDIPGRQSTDPAVLPPPAFYGFPDWFHRPTDGRAIPVTDPLFAEALIDIPPPQPVLSESFRERLRVEDAISQLEYHGAANKFDIVGESRVGLRGELYVAQTGSFVPLTGAMSLVGYKVSRLDLHTHRITDFVVHTSQAADLVFRSDGVNKPIDVKVRRHLMLMVDFGVFEPGLHLAEPGTGKVWVIFRDSERQRSDLDAIDRELIGLGDDESAGSSDLGYW